MRRITSLSRTTNQVFDAVCALSVMLMTFAFVNIGRMPGGLEEFLAVRLTMRNVASGLVLMAIWRASFKLFGLYDITVESLKGWGKDILRIVAASTFATTLVLCVAAVGGSDRFSVQIMLYFWGAAIATEVVGRALIKAIVPHLTRGAGGDVKQAVIVGSGPRALRLLHAVQTEEFHNCEVMGFVDTVGDRVIPDDVRSRMISSLEGFEALLWSQPIDQVLIALPVKSCYDAIQRSIDVCERVGVEVIYFPDIFAVSHARREYAHQGGMQTVRLQRVANDHRLVVKRAIDAVGAFCGLLLLSPLLALCAIAVKASGPGPVLFSQVRYGFNRRLFRMYKFRTMVQDAEQLQGTLESQNEARGPIFKIRADPRITRIGRIMRKLSLDELPQLFNVLKGEMSLVGPRPMSMRDVSRFSDSWLMRRFSVRPGLTCLWQVNGRSNTDFDRWVELDLAYIDNWSLSLDMRILIKTVPAVISGTGAM